MTTNKPEVVGFATHHDEPMLLPSKGEATIYCDDGEEPVALIRLSDYEALQAECEKLRKDAERYRFIRDAEELPMNLMRLEMIGDAMDSAIDAAMGEPRAAGGLPCPDCGQAPKVSTDNEGWTVIHCCRSISRYPTKPQAIRGWRDLCRGK